MNEDGYTLTEMLAALLMIGLAVGGLSQGLRVIGLLQGATGRALGEERGLRAAKTGLEHLLGQRGPFRSTEPGFRGEASAFQVDCGAPEPCGAGLETKKKETRLLLRDGGEQERSVRLMGPGKVRFTYDGPTGSLPSWPPSGRGQTLKAVNLVRESAEGEAPLLTTRLWREQAGDCAFDAISKDCRERGQ
jgi:prepilin-type N-terminal cleavage/methylation domain-containing protein